MTKEQALELAKEFDLEHEVTRWHDKYVDEGISDELAWVFALYEWDII